MHYGLKEEIVQKIRRVFAKYPEIDSALLYGSRAKGSFRPGSDIDLTLVGENIHLHLLNKISLDLDDLLLPYTMDLSIYSHITNSGLIEHIQRVGKPFYRKSTEEAP